MRRDRLAGIAIVLAMSGTVLALFAALANPAPMPVPGPTSTVWDRVSVRTVLVPVTTTPSPYPTHQPWILTRTAEALTPHPVFPTQVPTATTTVTTTPLGVGRETSGKHDTR